MNQKLFSADEERLLKTTPVLVIAAAAYSQPGDTDTIVHEMEAGAAGLGRSLAAVPSEVVAQLFGSLDDKEYDVNAIIDAETEPQRIVVIEGSLDQAKAARSLLRERTGTADADAYAAALMAAAEAAVHSSRERGRLWMAGTEVSELEEVYLDRLADALGVIPPG